MPLDIDRRVGILGGGQLGLMLTEAAIKLKVRVVTLDQEHCPVTNVIKNPGPKHIVGSFTDPNAIRRLAAQCDILTTEIEHVDTHALEELSSSSNTNDRSRIFPFEVQPHWRTIRTIQDKYLQKVHLGRNKFPIADSLPIGALDETSVLEVAKTLGYPFMLKSRTEAYDGKGNSPVKSAAEIPVALNRLRDRPLYAERWVGFSKELAVMVVKLEDEAIDSSGQWEKATVAYPVVETIHENSICKLVYAPARNVSEIVMQRAQALARQTVAGFWGTGIFGVELFLLNGGDLIVNEIAPRPHNSGHYTIEACHVSQFEAHLKSILRIPVTPEDTRLRVDTSAAVMLNILGGAIPDTHVRVAEAAESIPGAHLHMYGKGESRPGRKMGHVTIVGSSMYEVEERVESLLELLDRYKKETKSAENVEIQAMPKAAPQGSFMNSNFQQSPPNGQTPLVAITMGSESDRFVLTAGIDFLKAMGVPHIVTITSAHRTPERMFRFAREAASKGIKVIIAAAGGAAHLPGMIAAITTLPVIGIPVKGSVLNGNDSLLSIVQMPRGCPVATVAINNSTNAAQLAVRILALNNEEIRGNLEKYLTDQTALVTEKGERMERIGFEAYNSEEN